MSEISIKIGADGVAAVREMQKVEAGTAQVNAKLRETAKVSREAGNTQAETYRLVNRELASLDRQAARVADRVATPIERYQKALRELNVLHRMGKLSSEQLAAAVHLESKRFRESTEAAGGLFKLTPNLLAFAGGFLSVGSAVAMATHALQAMQKDADAAALSLDEVQRRFRVTAELKGLSATKAQESIERIAVANAVSPEQAYTAATQLASSGFSAQEASGGSLDVFLKTQGAMAVAGKDVDQAALANAFSGYLTSQGKPLNQANVMELGKAMSGVRAGNFDLEDLNSLAKEGASLTALSIPEQLSAATVLKNAGMDNPGTAMRNLVLNLQTAGSEDGKLEALAQLGLKPADIDLVGEDFDKALGRVNSGLQKLPQEARPNILKKLFEREGISTLNLLSSDANRDQMQDYQKLAESGEGFDSAVAEMQAGPNAAKRRLEGQKQIRIAQNAVGADERVLALEEAQYRTGVSGVGGLSGALQRGIYRTALETTGSPFAATMAYNVSGLAINPAWQLPKVFQASAAAETGYQQAMNPTAPAAPFSNPGDAARLAAATERTNQLLEEQNALMRQQQNKPAPVEVVNQQKAPPLPPKPRPSQALSR